MDDYLSKPIRSEELAAALGRCTSRAAAEVLDRSALADLEAATGDPAFVAELAETFLREAPALVATLRSAETDDLRRAAHTLKANARTFGATALADLCQALESAATAGTLDPASGLAARIEDEYARVAAALGARRDEARRG
jgi:HPt (histidine-containing phosphotransfer) domain-containing protein